MTAPRFVFHACLGAGGFGEVYLATETTEGGLERVVAVKVLHEPLDEASDAVKRLRDEGQVLALLAHPAVLGVHELAQVDGHLALVTEYVEGVDLAWFCVPERLLPPRVAVLVAGEVAAALEFALSTPNPETGRPLGLIHRDLKPENVRIAKTGQVKVLDFGVARSTEMHRRARTAAGQVILTPGYGAPETLQFGVLGPAVDVFALGVTLFAMLTGQTFYANDDLGRQVLLASDSVAYREHAEARLAQIADPDLHALVRDMVEFAHEHRPTMREIADRCDRLAHRLPGPTLLQWVRTATFPEPGASHGRYDGAHVSSTGAITRPTPSLPLSQAPTVIREDPEPPPPPRRPEPPSEPPPPARPAHPPPPAPTPQPWFVAATVALVAGVLLLLVTAVAVAVWGLAG
ncbi:MAG: serine/threonine protein kinase [Myxococcales bacterium]|nr:serine/threonine protein kinase [Myxococcales bacterium]